jgi:PKD repeat protein
MRPRSKTRVSVWPIVVLAILVLASGLAAVATLHGAASSRASGGLSTAVAAPSRVASPQPSASASLLASAATSLAAGAGPAKGSSWACSDPSGTALSCKIPGSASLSAHLSASGPSVTHPAVPASPTPAVTSSPAWYNQSAYANSYLGSVNTPTTYSATAAYDPYHNEVVLFGGCSWVCPTNATWVYTGNYVWTNETASIGGYIPAMVGQSMVWDPQWGSVIVAGGANVYGVGMNWTWGFYGSTWLNLTPYTGPIPSFGLPGIVYSAMAYDDALHEAVLVDGCSYTNCTDAYSATWILNTTGWYFIGLGPTAGNWSWPHGMAMAYDAYDQELVMFGGLSFYDAWMNGTFLFNGGWTNVTGFASGGFCLFGCIVPPALLYASMTWDAALGEVVMVGGLSASGLVNDTWEFYHGYWYLSGLFSSVAGPLPTYEAAMPDNSTDISPAYLGGLCATWCFNDTWVYESPPNVVFNHILPSPTEVGVAVNVSASLVPGSGSGPYLVYYLYDTGPNFFLGSYSGVAFGSNVTFDRTFAYAGTGTVSVYAEVVDFFGLYGYVIESLTVNSTPTAAPFGTPATTEVGVATTLDAQAAQGVGPYTYAWYFGDHTAPSTAASPSHTYAAVGTYTGWVVVTDAYAYAVNASYSIVVVPHVTAAPAPTQAFGEAGILDGFTAGAANGVGSYSYVWHFGDHTPTATGAAPSHAYAAAGTYHGWVVVTDGIGGTVNSSFTAVVNASLTASPHSVPGTTEVGLATTFSSGAAHGVPSYHYLWYLGSGSLVTTASPSITPAAAGTLNCWVNVTDALGGYSNESFSVTVDLGLTASAIHPSSSSPDTSTNVTFNLTVAHGTGGYTYVWSVGGVPISHAASPKYTFGNAQTYTVSVTVTDSAGASVTKSLSVTVSKAPTSTFLGLPSTEGYGLLAALIIVVIAALAGAMMMRRRRRATPPPPTNTTGSSPTDSSGTPPASPPQGAS